MISAISVDTCSVFIFAVLAGIGVLVLMVPVNVLVAQKSRVLQSVQMEHKDDRLKLFNEVLSGIKVRLKFTQTGIKPRMIS